MWSARYRSFARLVRRSLNNLAIVKPAISMLLELTARDQAVMATEEVRANGKAARV
jgi:hypothetical protein